MRGTRVPARSEQLVDERLHTREVVGVVVEGDVRMLGQPRLEIGPLHLVGLDAGRAFEGRVVVQPVDYEERDRLVPCRLTRALLVRDDHVREPGPSDRALETHERRPMRLHTAVERTHPAIVRVDRVDPRIRPERAHDAAQYHRPLPAEAPDLDDRVRRR